MACLSVPGPLSPLSVTVMAFRQDTVSAYACAPAILMASLARAVKVNFPVTVGRPLQVPSVSRLRPVGSSPEMIEKVQGVALPLLAVKVCVYAAPKVASRRAGVLQAQMNPPFHPDLLLGFIS